MFGENALTPTPPLPLYYFFEGLWAIFPLYQLTFEPQPVATRVCTAGSHQRAVFYLDF